MLHRNASLPSSPALHPASALSWPRCAAHKGYDLLIAADEARDRDSGERSFATKARQSSGAGRSGDAGGRGQAL